MSTTTKPSRYTVSLPEPLEAEVAEFSERTGISVSDLLRQGMVRVVKEKRATGKVEILALEPLAAAA